MTVFCECGHPIPPPMKLITQRFLLKDKIEYHVKFNCPCGMKYDYITKDNPWQQ